MLSFVFLNAIILLNVVIAMMADTYANMTSMRQGIYNYNILLIAPAYKLDKRYGAITALPTPLTIFTFILLPYYLCVNDKDRLESFNMKVYKTAYFFVSVVFGIIFVAINLILLPFGYLKTCWYKIKLCKRDIIPVSDVLLYVLGGLIMGIVVQVPDLWAFIKQSWNQEKAKRSDKTFVLSREEFENFFNIVTEHELEQATTGRPLRAFDLIQKMRELLELEDHIMTAIYGIDMKAKKARQAAKKETKEDVFRRS